MSAVAADSESELRRSGNFERIFPVAGTAHKYLKFFEGPRPLERMLADSAAAAAAATDKAPLVGGRGRTRRCGSVEKRDGRRGIARKCRNGRFHGEQASASVSPVRDLQFP